MSDSFVTQWAVAHQGFPRQEYWSGLSFPSPGNLPNIGIKLISALQADSLPLRHQGSPMEYYPVIKNEMMPLPQHRWT